MGLVDANQLISQLKHVVSQRDDDELCISCSLLSQISTQTVRTTPHHVHSVGLYRICFWEIQPEPDFAGFVKQIRQEPVPESDFTL